MKGNRMIDYKSEAIAWSITAYNLRLRMEKIRELSVK